MNLNRLPLRRTVRWLSAALLSTLAGLAHANCSAPRDAGACPLQAGPLAFDRCFGSFNGQPTPLGNQACNALRDSNKLLNALGANANKAKADAERDWKAFVTVATRDAIDTEAVLDIQRALGTVKEIERDVNAFLQDRECGTPAAMATLNRKFTEAASFLAQAGQVGQQSLEAAGKLRPVADELGKIGAELQRLSAVANAKGGQAKADFDLLQRAVQELQQEVGGLLATDFAGVVSSGASFVSSVGPFVAQCAGCATALSGAISSLTVGGTVTVGGGALCPETAGAGCVAAAVSLPVSAVGTGLGTALATPACAAAATGMLEMEQKYRDITTFVNGMVKLATSLPKSVTQAVSAGQALTRLAGQLGNEGRQSIVAIQASLNRMQPAFDDAGDTLERQIAPRVSRMAGDFITTLGQDTARLGKCFHKLQALTADLSGDVYEGLTLLLEAGPEAIDAGKIVSNLQTQGGDAVEAARDFADREWNRLKDEQRSLNRRAWGVDPGVIDPGKTVPHLIGLVARPAEVADIANDNVVMLGRQADILVKSVDAGKRAFLNQDRLTIQAKAKYSNAKAKAKRATIEIAKAKAKAKARMAAAQKTDNIAQMRPLAVWPNAPRPRFTAVVVR
ncbi:MAG: hypothetical protein O9335_13100 [Inhella sp.]|uniref:hypothetical protein n=1 Tax=Inhella sp. TaxID=1921806 RepID=UPI0022C63313|nr:hypothetical protein [Inhella sp.]MCZ8236084.1 hypothetical protein [Inhella sp.]